MLYKQTLTVSIVQETSPGNSRDALDNLSDAADYDTCRAYDVYVDPRPLPPSLDAHPGDVYVYLAEEADGHAVHVYTEEGWTLWEPYNWMTFDMVGLNVYAAPCGVQGLRYVGSAEQYLQAIEKEMGVGTLAELIAKDVDYVPPRPPTPQSATPQSRKRAASDQASNVEHQKKTKTRAHVTESTPDETPSWLRRTRSTQKAKAMKQDEETSRAKEKDNEGNAAEVRARVAAKGTVRKATKKATEKVGGKGKGKEKTGGKATPMLQTEAAGDGGKAIRKERSKGNVTAQADMEDRNSDPAIATQTTIVASWEDITYDMDVNPPVHFDDAMSKLADDFDGCMDVDADGEDDTQYNRLMEGSHPPPKLKRRLSWSAHDVGTFRPWTCNKDLDVAIFMSRSPKATNVVDSSSPMLIEMQYEKGQANPLRARILSALARGTAVLVHGWEPAQAVQFCKDDISAYRPPLDQTIILQDANIRGEELRKESHERDYGMGYVKGTMSQFIDASENPAMCQNCLDLPVLSPEIPPFVKGLMDDQSALMTTAIHGYIQPDGKSSGGILTEMQGPQTMRFDAWRSSGWDILTHRCFVTYPHHDAGGLATYAYMRSGAKVWAYIILDGVDEEDQPAVFDGWGEYYGSPLAADTYNKKVKVGTILLEHGAVLIQPPGANHMVYTPTYSMMSGGHFYAYDTMHLTEFAIVFDLGLDQEGRRRDEASNSLHPGAPRKIYRMAIALPSFALSRQFYRRSIIGMASIVQMVGTSMEGDGVAALRLGPGNIITEEESSECAAAESVLGKIMQKWGIVDAYSEMRKGSWREPGILVSLDDIHF